jgi:hypothetical protein
VTDRAVSSAVSYVLLVTVALILTTGLILGTGTLVENQREQAVRGQLEVVGQQLASTVASVDRLNATEAEPSTAAITRQFPHRAAGAQYFVGVVVEDADHGRYAVYLDAPDANINVTVPVRVTDVDLRKTRIVGGPLRVAYEPATDEVVIESV